MSTTLNRLMKTVKTKLRHIFYKQPDTLVIGSGGIKGAAKLGVLLFLEQIDKLKFDTIIGCSVGSIIGLLLTVGYKPSEMITMAYKSKSILDEPKIDIANIKKYLLDIGPLKKYLSTLIRQKLGYIPNLSTLYHATGKHFIAVTTNPIKKESMYLDYKNYPDLCVVEAVIHSSRIPILFNDGLINDTICVDGALSDPFPIGYVDNKINTIFTILAIEDESCYLGYKNIIEKIKVIINMIISPLIVSSYESTGDNVDHVILRCNADQIISFDDTSSIYSINDLIASGYKHLREEYYKIIRPQTLIKSPIPINPKKQLIECINHLSNKQVCQLIELLASLDEKVTDS